MVKTKTSNHEITLAWLTGDSIEASLRWRSHLVTIESAKEKKELILTSHIFV